MRRYSTRTTAWGIIMYFLMLIALLMCTKRSNAQVLGYDTYQNCNGTLQVSYLSITKRHYRNMVPDRIVYTPLICVKGLFKRQRIVRDIPYFIVVYNKNGLPKYYSPKGRRLKIIYYQKKEERMSFCNKDDIIYIP